MIRATLLFIILTTSTAITAAEPLPAPFGLSWDMSAAELKSIGFAKATTTGGLDIYSSVSVPKAWSKGETYMAAIYNEKLVKVIALSTDITEDVYGSRGKAAYEELKEILTQKYGAPDSFERIGMSLYDESDEFYQCLDYAGCGAYISTFEMAGGTVGLQLKGKSRGVGYLTVSYESPAFAEAKAAIERGDKESDSDAF